MKVRIRKDSNNIWSFVEVWNNKYKYSGYGVVKSLVSIELGYDTYDSLPLQLKGGEFQSLTTSLDFYSLEQWISSKKPIYSKISGIFVRFIVRYDLETLEPDFSKSYFELYQPIMNLATEEFLPLTRVFNVSSDLKERLTNLMVELFSGSVDRVTFLERRLSNSEGNKNN